MNPRTRKIIDNQIWEYLETLGSEAGGEGGNAVRAWYKLSQISTVAKKIRNEVDSR